VEGKGKGVSRDQNAALFSNQDSRLSSYFIW